MTLERMIEAVEEHERCRNLNYFIQKYFKEGEMTNADWKHLGNIKTANRVLKRLKLTNKV